MVVVKKVDSELEQVTILSDGVLQTVEFEKFLTIPKVDDIVQIQQSVDGASKYVVVNNDVAMMAPTSSKSKLAAGLLGIFLGGWGIHNFYLGNTGKAIAQLLIGLFGWFILLGWVANLWGLIEGILILSSQKGSSWHKDSQGNELAD